MSTSVLHLQTKTGVRQEKETEKKNRKTGKGNCPCTRAGVWRLSPLLFEDATAYLHGDLGKCVILTSRVPVTSFLPITLHEGFITALSGAVDRIFKFCKRNIKF